MKKDDEILPGDIAEEKEPEILMDDVEFVDSTEDGDELPGDQKVKKLQEKIKALEKEKAEYLDGWQRARADYANLQKQTEEDKKNFKAHFAERFVEDLLPVVDSFSMAMSDKEAWGKVDPNWRTGVEYIYNQLMSALKEHNLEEFGRVGDTFDPMLHEAVSETETGDKNLDHTIASVLQKGYRLADNVLRAARVTIYTIK